jgi:hypothetical protein
MTPAPACCSFCLSRTCKKYCSPEC